ncbi:MAG: hypothetical protein ABJD97_15665 [Betaproteobacteria bacterium]
MKHTLIAATGVALLAASGLASAASWSVVVQPGVYGRVAIGGYVEAPQVYSAQPVMAVDNGYGDVVEEYVDTAYATSQPPVYLWVPEYQRTHWAQYCREYGAYGVPVYFVDDGWYRNNVMRHNWTVEQRSWNASQWIEADRIARDRFERQRFEQQRYQQQPREQQRWNNERAWHEQQRQNEQQRDQRARWDNARWDHDRADHDRADRDQQDRMRWGSAHGYVPQPQQPVQPRPQPGNGWQQPGQGGQGHGGQQPGGQQTGWQGNHGNAGQVPAPQQPQWPVRGSAHGAPVAQPQPIRDVSDRRDDHRSQEQRQTRGQADGRGQFEHGRDGNRDR